MPTPLDGIQTCTSGIRAHRASDYPTRAGMPRVSRNKHFRHSPASSIVKQSCKETLQLVSARRQRQTSARTSAESDEVCVCVCVCVCACVRACVGQAHGDDVRTCTCLIFAPKTIAHCGWSNKTKEQRNKGRKEQFL